MTSARTVGGSSAVAIMRTARPLLVVGGFALAACLVRSVGTERVLQIVRASGRLLPIVVLLEATFATCDSLAARVLLGTTGRAVTGSSWIRATALAYASTVLLPAGRIAGEAARAAALSRDVGVPMAVAACSRLQSCALLANAVVCLACVTVVGHRGGDVLRVALAVNVIACSALAAVFLGALRSKRLTAWLGERFISIAGMEAPTPLAEIGVARTFAAQSLCVLGRAAQTVQYGVVLLAVGGIVTPTSALTAQGIHLVGAAVGDVIPGQLGAMEGTYRAFAGSLGLGADLASALSMPLIVRIAQLGMSIVCLSVCAAGVTQRTRRAEPS